jgi:hypothetical protein
MFDVRVDERNNQCNNVIIHNVLTPLNQWGQGRQYNANTV